MLKYLKSTSSSDYYFSEFYTYAILGYSTTIRTSIDETSYVLIYGWEAVILAEVEIHSLRIIQEVGLDDAGWICSRNEQLMCINEKTMDTVYHGQLY